MIPWTSQIISLSGALLILVAYIGHQAHWMRPGSAAYNLLNVVGSSLLGYAALKPFQAGFVLMESVWAVVSLLAFLRSMRSVQS